MSTKISLVLLSVGILFATFGCGPSQAAPTPEEKKAFMGSAPPKGYMGNIHPPGADEAAAKAAAKDMAAHANGN